MKLNDLAGTVAVLRTRVASAATAATAETSIGQAPFRSKVVGAYFIADAAMSGAASANRVISIVNKVSGAGTAIPATKIFTAAVDATAYDNTVLTVSTTASDINVAEGDVLSVQQLVTSTGLPCSAGTIEVYLQAR